MKTENWGEGYSRLQKYMDMSAGLSGEESNLGLATQNQ